MSCCQFPYPATNALAGAQRKGCRCMTRSGWFIGSPGSHKGDFVFDVAPDYTWSDVCDVCGKAGHHLIDVVDCCRQHVRATYGDEPVVCRSVYDGDWPPEITPPTVEVPV